eukprot:GHVU01042793.1.p1 GENE.GHVU01042793.1~~GHVU01042793.1.p1  ORF type:complete len:106 (-),score=10.95 GHVU01042793.1:241-558(-)
MRGQLPVRDTPAIRRVQIVNGRVHRRHCRGRAKCASPSTAAEGCTSERICHVGLLHPALFPPSEEKTRIPAMSRISSSSECPGDDAGQLNVAVERGDGSPRPLAY